MAGRIVLFGATGYTGRLVAEALVARGARPLLAGRNQTAPGGSGRASGGTEASAAGVMLDPSFVFRNGQLETERGGQRVGSFEVDGRRQPALSVGGSEHFGLPPLHPQLRDVDVYLGFFGPLTRPMQVFSLGISAATRVPGARAAMGTAVSRLVPGSTGGPSAERRATGRSYAVAMAFDAEGAPLAEARLDGVGGYTFTGRILAWGAMAALDGGLRGEGALGPVSAFGLDELERGCAEAGLRRVA